MCSIGPLSVTLDGEGSGFSGSLIGAIPSTVPLEMRSGQRNLQRDLASASRIVSARFRIAMCRMPATGRSLNYAINYFGVCRSK